MKQVPLGRSGVKLSQVVFGGAPIGGLFEAVSDNAAHSTLEAAWKCGIRSFDTAPHYGVGLSEHRIGAFLREMPRQEWALSSKVGRLLEPTTVPIDGTDSFFGTPVALRRQDYSREGVLRSVEDSLRRLGLDTIDLLLVHDPDDHEREALEGAFPTLLELRAQGVVKAVGAGMNYSAPLTRFVRDLDLDVVLIAGRWTLLDRSAGRDLLPMCAERKTAVLVGGVFNSGILANPVAGTTYDYSPATAEMLRLVQEMASLCESYNVPLAAAALQFPLRHDSVTAITIGFRTAQEVEQDVGYLDLQIPEVLWSGLDDLVAAHG